MKRRCFLRLAFPSRSFGTRKYRLIFNNSGLEGGVSAWWIFALDSQASDRVWVRTVGAKGLFHRGAGTRLGDVLHVH